MTDLLNSCPRCGMQSGHCKEPLSPPVAVGLSADAVSYLMASFHDGWLTEIHEVLRCFRDRPTSVGEVARAIEAEIVERQRRRLAIGSATSNKGTL